MLVSLFMMGAMGLVVLGSMSFKFQSSQNFYSAGHSLNEDDWIDQVIFTLQGRCDDYLDDQSVAGKLPRATIDRLISDTPGARGNLAIEGVVITSFRPNNGTLDAPFVNSRAEFSYRSNATGAPLRKKSGYFIGRVRVEAATSRHYFVSCDAHGTPYSFGLYWGAPCAIDPVRQPLTAVGSSPSSSDCSTSNLGGTVVNNLCRYRNAFRIQALQGYGIAEFCNASCRAPNNTLPECDNSAARLPLIPGGVDGLTEALAQLRNNNR